MSLIIRGLMGGVSFGELRGFFAKKNGPIVWRERGGQKTQLG